MNWKSIEGERYAIQSQCGKFRIAKSCHDEVEIFTLFGKEDNFKTPVANFRSPDSAKATAEQIAKNRAEHPRDYE